MVINSQSIHSLELMYLRFSVGRIFLVVGLFKRTENGHYIFDAKMVQSSSITRKSESCSRTSARRVNHRV